MKSYMDKWLKIGHLKQYPLKGVERELLRMDETDRLSKEAHPMSLGHPLTHPQITTDFSESMLELISRHHRESVKLVHELKCIHQFTFSNLGKQWPWPYSMPMPHEKNEDIPIARYGETQSAKMKEKYRQGLKERYGGLMQVISGIHYNFSLPEPFWELAIRKQGTPPASSRKFKDEVYMGLIRNFHRYCYILPYLFGASPLIHRSFLQGRKPSHLTSFNDSFYGEFATSLRLGDWGYGDSAQKELVPVNYNSLRDYLKGIYKGLKTRHPESPKFNVKNHLNLNLLQVENEYYGPIRPKRVTYSGEPPIAALSKRGIEYIEVRCLDICPLTPIGLSEKQLKFIDLFLFYCAFKDSPFLSKEEFSQASEHFLETVNRGRDPLLEFSYSKHKKPFKEVRRTLYHELLEVANYLDTSLGGCRNTHKIFQEEFLNPSMTRSGVLLKEFKERNTSYLDFFKVYGDGFKSSYKGEPLQELCKKRFQELSIESLNRYLELSKGPTQGGENFIENYFKKCDESLEYIKRL